MILKEIKENFFFKLLKTRLKMIEKNKINKILIYKLIKALANRVDIHKLFNQQLKTL
jgi:hypothetical protein